MSVLVCCLKVAFKQCWPAGHIYSTFIQQTKTTILYHVPFALGTRSLTPSPARDPSPNVS